MITEGQRMPDAILPCLGGPLALNAGPMVLFTYGKDGTPTCTNEVRDFDALGPAFAALGISVVGLSKDKLASHERFAAKQGLSLRLASDHGTDWMERLGAYGQKLFFGKMVTGVLRSTFLVDAQGRVTRIWKVDKVAGHADEVLAWVRSQ